MVTRKPLPPSSESHNTIPYPSSPAGANTSESYERRPASNQSSEGLSEAAENAADAQEAWGAADSRENLPTALKIGDKTPASKRISLSNMNIPDSLRIRTPTPDHTPRSSEEGSRPEIGSRQRSNNPYLQKQFTGQSAEVKESSASAWGSSTSIPSVPSGAPPNPTVKDDPPLIGQFAELAVDDNTNPWKSAASSTSGQASQVPDIRREDSGSQAWSDAPEHPKPAFIPPVLVTLATEEEESGWDATSAPASIQPRLDTVSSENVPERAEWDDSTSRRRQKETSFARERQAQEAYLASQAGGWENDTQEQQSGTVNPDGTEFRPPLPRKNSDESRPALPPRPSLEDTAQSSASQSNAPPGSGNESRLNVDLYSVKQISWHDANAPHKLRSSPILLQNANGPCPILALVNGLVLSTPPDIDTPLVTELRRKEHVSITALLDAIADELVSGRRGDEGLAYLDELYPFLKKLNTGLIANPRFFPPPPTNTSNDPRRSMSHVHPSEREDAIPGTFEETRAVKLYSTFSIPLVHGWLPEPYTPEYEALKRVGPSYDEAASKMIDGHELQQKAAGEGLSFEEQAKLEDILAIGDFLRQHSTQLTTYGLDIVTKSTAPGSVAILFRNDHFSLLYRHPETGQLFQLVTDEGYARYPEVVWESLVSVNGEGELFSGDFRLIGDSQSSFGQGSASHDDNDGEWETVSHSNRRNQNQSQPNYQSTTAGSDTGDVVPPLTPMEQTDHDLALAIQLQDEEEAAHRANQERRRREDELNQQYIEQSSGNSVPTLHPSPAGRRGRGGNVPVTSNGSSRSHGRRNSDRGGSGGGGGGRGSGAGNRGRVGSQPTNLRVGPVPGSYSVSGIRDSTTESRPTIPPRRSNIQAVVRPPDPEAGVDAPPPSYEQASVTPPYNPPLNHPSHPASSPNMGQPASPIASGSSPSPMPGGLYRQQSAYSQNSQTYVGAPVQGQGRAGRVNSMPGGGGRRPQMQPQGVGQDDREDKCIVM